LHDSEPEKVALWEAFYKIEPFGNEWERSAMVANTVATMVAASAGVKSKSQLSDFMPDNWDGRRSKKRSSIEDFRKFAAKYKK